MALLLAAWLYALPQVPWKVWLVLGSLRLVVTRLPLIPNKDLIFVGAGIAAAGIAKVSVTPVAMVLVILAAADLILAATVASLAWLIDAKRARA